MKYYVYILYSKSADSFYKGQTKDLTQRILQHNSGKESVTKRYAPWKLVWCTEVESRSEAVILERKIKNLSKDRLIVLINKNNLKCRGS